MILIDTNILATIYQNHGTGFDYWLIVAGNFVAPEFGALLSRALGFRALLSKENSFSNVGGFLWAGGVYS